MAEKSQWLKVIKAISLIGIVLSIIGFILFIIPAFGGEWGGIVSIGIFLPSFLFFLFIWLIGIWINYLIGRNKVLANIISGIGLIASIFALIRIIATPNWLLFALISLMALCVMGLIFFGFLLYMINRK